MILWGYSTHSQYEALYVFLRLLFNLVVGALKVVMSQLFIKQLFLASLLRLWPTANMQSTPHGGCEKQKGPPVGCLTFSICQSDWWHSKFSRRSFFEQSNKLLLRSKLSCSLHHLKSVTLTTKLNSGVEYLLYFNSNKSQAIKIVTWPGILLCKTGHRHSLTSI